MPLSKAKTKYMRSIIVAAFAIGLLTTCSKKESKNSEEYLLYGKWEMGPHNGDTIEFLNKGGRNILRFYDSVFITGIYAEREYRYVNGALSIRMYPIEDFTPISSFTWQQQGNKFSVLSSDFYPLLSLSVTLVYTKIP